MVGINVGGLSMLEFVVFMIAMLLTAIYAINHDIDDDSDELS